METALASLLCTLAHIPTLVLRISPFRPILNAGQKKTLSALYAVGLVFNFFLVWFLFRQGQMDIGLYKIHLLVFCAIMGMVNILVVPGYWREHMFSFGLTAMVFWLCFGVAAFTAGHFGLASQSQMLILENLLGLTLFSLLYPWSRRLAKTTVTPFLIQKNEKYWKTIWFVPIALFLSGILSRGYQGYSDSVGDLVSILLVSIAAYLICRRVAQDYGALQEKEQLNRQVRLQKQYYSALTEAVEKERKQRHNFKHQLAAIRGFLDSGDTAALREYCDGMEIGMADIAQIPYTGNPAADGVLYYYAGEAKKQHIDYTVRCRLDHLDIADTDLCCLLGNALDNAVTACAAYSGPREIVIASEKSGGALLLTVDNSFDGTLSLENGVLLSQKRPHSRGIGIPSMEEICQKYDGTCRFEGKGSRFEASFFLRLQE